MSIGLYVHVPFCAARCPYCDFATAPARDPLRARYLAALAKEIARRGAELARPRVDTLYFGGGTPSLLEPAEVRDLAGALRDAFDLRAVEVTIEANPATLDAARLDGWRELVLTRVSLGAQSLHPHGLRALGRTHSVDDVARSVTLVRAAGISDLNLDLIFGWPRETREEWREDLARAIALEPDHLSCYPLTLEREPEEAVGNWRGGGWAVLARWRDRAAAAQPDDDALADMYVDAERALARGGFEHYEIANWSRPGHRCAHNLRYWRDGDWLGVGLGAHSHLAGRRSWNTGRLVDYVARWESGAPELASQPDDAGETAMLALRLREGLDFGTFVDRRGEPALEEVRARLGELEGTGLLRRTTRGIALTRRGRLLANEVFVRLLPAEVGPSRP